MLHLHNTSKSYSICNQESVYCCRERRPGTDPSCLWWLLSQLSNVQQHCLPEVVSQDVARAGEMKIQMIVTISNTYRILSYNHCNIIHFILDTLLFYHANDDDLALMNHSYQSKTLQANCPSNFSTHKQSEGQTIGSNTTPTKASEIFNVLVTPSTEPGHFDGGEMVKTFHDKWFANTGILLKDLFTIPTG